jgi:hypothetical protein
MSAWHKIWPYVVGLTVWGSSLTLMVHGLWTRAWYGYAFALIFGAFGLYFLIIVHRARKREAAELRRILGERSAALPVHPGFDRSASSSIARSEVMPARLYQILLVLSLLWLSWLAMMLVHEGGHVVGAVCTGGRVRRMVWHPAALSRTDVWPNPHPLIEVWAGPAVGSLVPLVIAGVASAFRLRVGYLVWVVAGFCLIANGAYLGVGAVSPVGDAAELIKHGTPSWWLAAFGVVTVIPGFWIWHRVSPRLGFGDSPGPVSARHAYGCFVLAVVVTVLGFALGDRGL